jgi:hypothetical protein
MKLLKLFTNSDGFEGTKGIIALLGGVLLVFVGRELLVRAALTSAFSEGTDPMYYVWWAVISISAGIAIGGPLWFWVGKPIRLATVNLDTTKATVSSTLSVGVPLLIVIGIPLLLFGTGVDDIQSTSDTDVDLNDSTFNMSPSQQTVNGSLDSVSPTLRSMGNFGLQVRYDFNASLGGVPTLMVKDRNGNVIEQKSVADSPTFVGLPASKQTSGGRLLVELSYDGSTLASENVSFEGADLSVNRFQLTLGEQGFEGGYWIDEVSLSMRNSGDTPVRITKTKVQIGTNTTVEFLPMGETIQPDSKKHFKSSTLSKLPGGQYDVRITVLSDDVTVATFNTTTTIESSS